MGVEAMVIRWNAIQNGRVNDLQKWQQ